MGADARDLAPLAEELAAAGARAIVPSRRGYGGSGAPEPYVGTTVHEQAQDAAALLEGLDAGPALVLGRGFGALIALDLLGRHAALVRGAVLVDPPAYAFVPDATRELAEQRGRIEEAVFAGGPAAGIAAWADGRLDAERLARAQAAPRAFFADYAGLATLPATRRELRAMTSPVIVLTTPAAGPHVLRAAAALAGLIPGSREAPPGGEAAAIRALL
jgi:pimeloyl-ACP methyl ester carboxylesterase